MAPKEKDYIELAHQRAAEKKTHVSFPQLKYPSLRDEGPKDPGQWLMGKALDDGAEGFWRIHNGLYDLDSFVKSHPGGSEWLELTKNTDITEAFEAHHLNPNVEKLLPKYYVRDAKTPRNSPFSFKDDGFYRTLRRAIYEELKKVPSHVPKYSALITDGLLITLLVSSVVACWAENSLLVNASYLIASLSLAWLVVASHNYIHRKTNWRMYLFNAGLWSYRDFRVSHVLSHHLYPNTLMDLEISGLEPVLQWNPRRDKPAWVKFSFIIEMFFFPTIFMSNFLKKMYLGLTKKGYFEQHIRWHDSIGLYLPIWMYFVSGSPLFHVIKMWLWINWTASFIFFNIGSNAAHHHPKIFKDGDEVPDPNPDFGLHELEAVMDRKDISGNLFRVMTFFGDHALHHLFPTLDHAILPYLYPVFLEHCKKFKGNFRMTSQFDLIIGQFKQCVKTEPNVLKDD